MIGGCRTGHSLTLTRQAYMEEFTRQNSITNKSSQYVPYVFGSVTKSRDLT